MAMLLNQTAAALRRATVGAVKNTDAFLDRRLPVPLLLPVRTKKRSFQPPPAGNKDKKGEMADKARAAGFVVRQEFIERPINVACSSGIFEPYVPPEGDARLSSLSKEGIKQQAERLRHKVGSSVMIREIKKHDTRFVLNDFAEQAQEIFIEAHNCLANFNKEKLRSLVTERCYPEMTRGNRYKTIRWTFVESIEPPKVVHAKCPKMMSESNLYGQVTVRMHSKQTLAIYDRFGRLIQGSETQPKDVLEYLVMERHLINRQGRWRLHGKIVPSWAPAKDAIIKTVMIPRPKPELDQEVDALDYHVPKPEAVQWSK